MMIALNVQIAPLVFYNLFFLNKSKYLKLSFDINFMKNSLSIIPYTTRYWNKLNQPTGHLDY